MTENQGEIRATGFNAQVDSFYDLLQEGKASFAFAHDVLAGVLTSGLLHNQSSSQHRQEAIQ